jgi:hypothetical protein
MDALLKSHSNTFPFLVQVSGLLFPWRAYFVGNEVFQLALLRV